MSTLLSELQSLLGIDAILTGPDVAGRETSWIDPSPLQAAAIVRPRSTAEVAAMLQRCHVARQPVIVHGGRTNLVDATRTGPDDLILSLERMTAVEEIDFAQQTLTVQAGAPLQKAQDAASDADLLFPLDLAARGSATIGGCIAMNAGGVRVLRYGVMRSLVLGLEVVLADGTVLTSMNKMLKNNAGYDLKQLFVGSEGTLGVVTRAVLRLFPRPRSTWTALAATDDFDQVVALLHMLQQRLGDLLASFEVMWADYYRLTTTLPATSLPPLPQKYGYYILIEALGDDPAAASARCEQALAAAGDQGLFVDAVVAVTAQQRAALWRVREDSEQIERQHHYTLGYDVSLPLRAMPAYVTTVRANLGQALGPEARCWVYGHLGDGNLHINVWAPSLQPGDQGAVAAAVYDPLRAVGGSISAEHGIGLEKKPYLAWSRTPAEIEVMRRLKRTLDPHNILNPGRVFDVNGAP